MDISPALAEKQVAKTREGLVAFELRRPRSDGTTHVLLDPLVFLGRLCALVPPPRQHQLRYFGVLAPASPHRSSVVPKRLVLELQPQPLSVDDAPRMSSAHRTAWASLLARVYQVDALRCPACGAGRLRVIAAITAEPVVKKILDHLALATELGPTACRDPPPLQLALDLEGDIVA